VCVCVICQNGDVEGGLTLAAYVGTSFMQDTRGPFAVAVPFVYNSSLHVSGYHTVLCHIPVHIYMVVQKGTIER